MSHVSRRSASFGLGSALLLGGASGKAAAQVQTRTLRFTAASNKGHPQVLGVERFAELVSEKSGGKIRVRPFPGGTLGPDLQGSRPCRVAPLI